MARRSRVVLPYLIPRLTTPPVNTKTLALLTTVAGEALSKHLGKVLPALLSSLQSRLGTELEEEELGYCKSVLLSVEDDNGVAILVDTLMSAAHKPDTRMAAVMLLDVFFLNTRVDIKNFFATYIRSFIRLYALEDPLLVKRLSSIKQTLTKVHRYFCYIFSIVASVPLLSSSLWLFSSYISLRILENSHRRSV